ncbi:MAG: hypothetical protein V1684_02930 [bacterium]
MVYLHGDLADGLWQQLTLMEQLGNIGSEISRALSWQAKGDQEQAVKALDRGLELFDLTIADPRWQKRLKEILRAREVVCDYFFGDNQYRSAPESLDKYFLYFGLAARSGKD